MIKRKPKEGTPVKNAHGYYQYDVTYNKGKEARVFGHVYHYGGITYFDEYQGERANWTERYNSWKHCPEKVDKKSDIKKLIGKENYLKFRQNWAALNLPVVKKYKMVRDFDTPNRFERMGMEVERRQENGEFKHWRQRIKDDSRETHASGKRGQKKGG